MCADVLPDVFKLDEWGYAYVESSGDVPADLEDLARHAIRSCPTDAISELDLTD
jgi:ferredoxin